MPRKNFNAGPRSGFGGGAQAPYAFIPEPLGDDGLIASWTSRTGWTHERARRTRRGSR